MHRWSRWHRFPDPSSGGYLSAPFGSGVYELRNRRSGELVYCGEGKNVAQRMTSLLPADAGGSGTRNNARLRQYLHDNLADIEYRTKAFTNKVAAKSKESKLQEKHDYRF